MPKLLTPQPRSSTDPVEIYEPLYRFNEHCRVAVGLAQIFGERKLVHRTECALYAAMLNEVRAAISQCIVECLNEQEISTAAAAEKRRLKLEQKLLGESHSSRR